jgi:UDP-glucuronate 4-epimerase
MARDFTYIDDIVDGLLGVIDHPARGGEDRLFNIGDSRPVGLMRMIEVLEQALGKAADKRMLPMQPGDVTATFADISRLQALCGYAPKVTLEAGLPNFVEWYRVFQRDSATHKPPL